jgi:hypothetical protein
MQVLREEDQTADFTRLQVRYQYTDGRVRDDSVQYFRYADGWRQAIPEAVVDKLGRNLQEVMAKQGAQVR